MADRYMRRASWAALVALAAPITPAADRTSPSTLSYDERQVAARSTEDARALIATIVEHYRSLDTYTERGRVAHYSSRGASEPYFVDRYEFALEREGRYRLQTRENNGSLSEQWGDPYCMNRYNSEWALYVPCKRTPGAGPSRLPQFPLVATRVIALGPGFFYRDDCAYRTEAGSGGRTRLVGECHGGSMLETFDVDATSGRILAAETTLQQGRIAYEFTASENEPLPDSAFRPLRAYVGRFNPLRIWSVEGSASMMLLAMVTGIVVTRLRARRAPGRYLAAGARMKAMKRALGWIVGLAAAAGCFALLSTIALVPLAFHLLQPALAAAVGATIGRWLAWPSARSRA